MPDTAPQSDNVVPSDPATPPDDPYASWRHPDYRRYASSWFLVMFSKAVETTAFGYYLANNYSESFAAWALAMLALVQALPVMLLAIPCGHIADRFDRRVVLVCALALSTCSSCGQIVVISSGASLAGIFLLFALSATAQALGSPSRSALLPQLVPASEFTNAVTWNSTMFYMGVVTGPIVGGLVMGTSGGLAVAFTLSTICRLTAMASAYSIRHRQTERGDQPISIDRLVAGIRFVWNTRLILATITLDLFAVLLGGAVYLLPLYTEHILHVGPIGLGFLRAGDALGALGMAVWLVHRPAMRRPGVALLWAVAGFGAATIVFGLSQWFWLSMLMMLVVGAMDNISVVVRHTLVQMLTPDEMRGRVSAINNVFIVASNDLGGFESGVTAGLFGLVPAVVGGGVGTILVVIAAACLWPEILRLGPLSSIRPAELPESDLERELSAS